jgi:molybdopterin-containing oxidoreductase family membrane subunit
MELSNLADQRSSQLPISPAFRPVMVVGAVMWLALFAFGLTGLYDRLAFDTLHTALGSYIPWGLWVSSYAWFSGLSSGSFFLSTLVYVFKVKQLEKVAPLALAVALITLIMGLLTIGFDLGHMGRAYRVFLHPNFRSVMAWVVWLYTAYFVLVIFETYFALRASLVRGRSLPGLAGATARLLTGGHSQPLTEEEVRCDRRNVTTLAAIGIPLAIAFTGGVGAEFATLAARDVWHTALYPILFLVGASLSGVALVTGLTAFFWPHRDDYWRVTVHLLGRITLGLLLLEALLTWAELSVPMWFGVGQEYQELHYMLFGPNGWVFWVVQLGLGTLVPLILLVAAGKSSRATGWAGILVAVTFLATRLNLVLPGLLSPELAGLQYSYHDGRLLYAYLPSWPEWQLLAFVISVGIALYVFAVNILPTLTGRDAA